jgi:oligo-1,6-glucosidase
MDLAVNHTSDEHAWFRRSRRGEKRYRDYYVWEDGDPDEPPNNWESLFGGSAWSYDDQRSAWFLHLFDERMPDLNWRNPDVREAVYETMEWWLEKGIDGFRLDVVNLLSKPEDLPDGDPAAAIPGSNYFMNGPKAHEYVSEMHERVFSDEDIMTIGETLDITPADARQYVVEDGLDMVFPFKHMDIDAGGGGPWDIADWDLRDMKAVTERWQTALDGGWIGLYLSNHDQPRMVSRFGDDDEYRAESAKMLATFLFTLRGTPFVYQGQEIGMTNAPFETIDEFRDPATVLRVERAIQTGRIDVFEDIREAVNYWSRDNARTPMQWSDEANAGFTSGEPWIKVNPNYTEVNAERERRDADSVLSYYRRLIDLRADHPVAVYGQYEPVLRDDPSVFAYRRTFEDVSSEAFADDSAELLVVLNFPAGRRTPPEATQTDQPRSSAADGDPSFELPDDVAYDRSDLLLANYDSNVSDDPRSFDLRPYEARIYRLSSR